eukprot:235701_1
MSAVIKRNEYLIVVKQNNILSNENQQLKESLSSLEAEVKHLRQKEQITNNLIQESKLQYLHKINSISDEFNIKEEALKSQHDNEIKSLNSKIESLKNELKTKESQIRNLDYAKTEDMKTYETEKKRYQQLLSSKQQNIRHLMLDIRDKNEEIKALKRELSQKLAIEIHPFKMEYSSSSTGYLSAKPRRISSETTKSSARHSQSEQGGYRSSIISVEGSNGCINKPVFVRQYNNYNIQKCLTRYLSESVTDEDNTCFIEDTTYLCIISDNDEDMENKNDKQEVNIDTDAGSLDKQEAELLG